MTSTATCGKCGEEVPVEILPPGYAHTGPPIPPEAIWICEDCKRAYPSGRGAKAFAAWKGIKK